jgi:hypothetical protein
MREAEGSVRPLPALDRIVRSLFCKLDRKPWVTPAMDLNAGEILCAQDAGFDPNQVNRNQKQAVRRRFHHKRSFRHPVYRRLGLGVLDPAEKSINLGSGIG